MTTPQRNRGWIWYFVALVVLASVAVTSLIVYNLGQQLRPEQLAAARDLWSQKGPADYRLRYVIKKGAGGVTDAYEVTVRGGKAESARVNGLDEPVGRLKYYGMGPLFDFIGRFQELDRQPGKPRTFTRAIFDPADGHLLWYVRRVMGSSERQEITVEALQPLENGPGSVPGMAPR